MKQGDACILSNEEDLKEHCEKEAAKVVSAVEHYIRPWPEREWGNEDIDSICIIAPSRMLVSVPIIRTFQVYLKMVIH